MQPLFLLRFGAEDGEDLGVSGIRRLVAENDRSPNRGALDLVHQAELDLPVTLASKVRRQVGGPQLLALDLLLQRPDRAHEPAIVGVQDLERIHLVAHETAHPIELGLEVRLSREIPTHALLLTHPDREGRCLRRSCQRWYPSGPHTWGPGACRGGAASGCTRGWPRICTDSWRRTSASPRTRRRRGAGSRPSTGRWHRLGWARRRTCGGSSSRTGSRGPAGVARSARSPSREG